MASSIFSSSGSRLGSSSFSPPSYHAPTAKSSGGGSHWYSGITGFIGHLGADIEHSVVGLPMGIIELIRHPIASGETMVKSEWQDWSPLFHGDFGLWAHNTYEHPLGPILDVLSVVTGGGALAGKLAEGTVKVGLADEAGSLARFANPVRSVLAEHKANALAKGLTEDAANQEAIAKTAFDPRAYKLVKGKTGFVAPKDAISNNPVIRIRQQALSKLAKTASESGTGQKLHLDKLIGETAQFRRWRRLDAGQRTAAVVDKIHRELVALHTLGKHVSSLKPDELYLSIEPTIRQGLEEQAHQISIKTLMDNGHARIRGNGKFVLTEQGAAAFREDGLKFVRDRSKVQVAMQTGESTALGALKRETGDKALHAALKAFGDDNTTMTLEDAQKVLGSNDAVHVIPTRFADKMTIEAKNSIDTVKLLYKYPTTVWKWMILAASPRYFVNNVVGNWLMMAASIDPVTMSKAFYNHMVTTKSQAIADKAAQDALRGSKVAGYDDIRVAKLQAAQKVRGKNIVERKYASEYLGHARSMTVDEEGNPVLATGIRGKARQGLFPITHIVSDVIPRNMAVWANLQRTPEFNMLEATLRRSHSAADARRLAAEQASESPGVRAFVRQQVNHTLGQYHTFSGVERTLQGIVPFYSWDRAITRHTANLLSSQPYKLAVVSSLSAQGVKKTEDMLGQLPSFLQGVIPEQALGGPHELMGFLFGQQGKGRTGILTTQSLNPYSTLGDVAGAIESVTGLAPSGQGITLGSTVGSQLNPILSGAAQSLSGTNLQTGAPIKHSAGGLIGDIISNLAQSTPAYKIGASVENKLTGGYPQPKKANQPFLYSKDTRSQIASFLGVGARSMGEETAHELARKEAGTKTTKLRNGITQSTTIGSSSRSSTQGRVMLPGITSGFSGGTGAGGTTIRIPTSKVHKIKSIPGL